MFQFIDGLEKATVWQSELGTGGPGEGQGGVNRTTGSGKSQGDQNWELVGLEKAKVE